MKNQIIRVVRDRGQITIPSKIRKDVQWIKPNAVISITVTTNELCIKPYRKEQKKEVNWNQIWKGIKWARSIKGKRGNLSKYIVEDRQKH